MYPYSIIFLFIALAASLCALSGTNLTANVLSILFWALFAISVIVGAFTRERQLEAEAEEAEAEGWYSEDYD
jgi:uncharacterized membrane protein YtjA (UPF0391 family)